MGTWGVFIAYDLGVLMVVRLLHFAIDPESSWTGSARRGVRRSVRRVRRRFARPRGRPIELIARDVRVLGRDLRGSAPCSAAELAALSHSYDSALAEACAALEVVHLLGVLAPGPERDAERRRVEARLALAGLCLEQAGRRPR
jgi:hypothetical protein